MKLASRRRDRRRSNELAALDDAAFRKRYAGTPVKRLGRERFVRNVMVAVGNAGNAALAGVDRSAARPTRRPRCAPPPSGRRGERCRPHACAGCAARRLGDERDPMVRDGVGP